MAKRDVVLLGERHVSEDDHRWQVQTLAALYALRPDMVIGFEMLPRRVQAALDRWVAGELTVKQFLEKTGWDEVWGMPAELYLPLVQFARISRIPMAALNSDRQLSRTAAAVHDVHIRLTLNAQQTEPPCALHLALEIVGAGHSQMRWIDTAGQRDLVTVDLDVPPEAVRLDPDLRV